MRSSKAIQVIGCHAEGEVGDVVVGGVAPPPGETLWAQSRWIAEDGTLRNFLLNEPRGGVFRHVNLLVPAMDPRAAMGFIIMEPMHTPPMSGSNAICVATVLLDSGIVAMTEPETRFHLEAPGGVIEVEAACRDGKAERITIRNVATQIALEPDIGGVCIGSMMMKPMAARGSTGGTSRLTWRKTPPRGSLSRKSRKVPSSAIHRDCAQIVSPGGGATPPITTSPTSPSAWQPMT